MVFIDFDFKSRLERVYIKLMPLNPLLTNLFVNLCCCDSCPNYIDSFVKSIKESDESITYEFPNYDISCLFNEDELQNAEVEECQKIPENETPSNVDQEICLAIPLTSSKRRFPFSSLYNKNVSYRTKITEGLVSLNVEGRLNIHNESQIRLDDYFGVGNIISGMDVIKEISQRLDNGNKIIVKETGIAFHL